MADSVPAEPGRPDPGLLAGVVLAAGAGRRLLPLTQVLPKPLCPVANRPLVDLAIEHVQAASGDVAVNVHHGRDLMEDHLRARADVWVSIEERQALGTAGALGFLRPWLDGRPALVVNGDTWSRPDLAGFAAGWDGERVRILVAGHELFGPRSSIVASILPWSVVAGLDPVPSGLYESCWRAHAAAGALETVGYDGPFVDCGTPASYLEANLRAVDGVGGSLVHPSAVLGEGSSVVRSVVGPSARIEGHLRNSVVWRGTAVHPAERLVGAIRASSQVTVLVR